MLKVRYLVYASPIGNIYVGSTEAGLCLSSLLGTEGEFRCALERLSGGKAVRDDGCFSGLTAELGTYFGGQKVEFAEPVQWLQGTVFQQSVWEALRKIPYGETRSYRAVAQAIGRETACRAVGQAVGNNPIPLIVPCHRVIASNGGLGGFGGGRSLKRRLLGLEGVRTPPA